jgi:hypothetical protein
VPSQSTWRRWRTQEGEGVMNKAAMRSFRKFIEEARKESDHVRIFSKVLNTEGLFEGLFPQIEYAVEWFEIVEPLLYQYICRAPHALITGKVIIAAEGILETSYDHLSDPWKGYKAYLRTGKIKDGTYKVLAPKLLIGPYKDPVVIDGEKYDDWLRVEGAATGWQYKDILLSRYDSALWVVPENPDDDDSPMGPALSYECMQEAAERWREVRASLPDRPSPREERRRLEGERLAQMRLKKAQLAREQRVKELEREGVDSKGKWTVPAVRIGQKLRKWEGKKTKALLQVEIPRMAERARMLGRLPRMTLRMVQIKEEWRLTGEHCGLLLEPNDDKTECTAPKDDFVFADAVFNEAALDAPLQEVALGLSRNQLEKPNRNKKMRPPDKAFILSLEKRRRESEQPIEEKIKEMRGNYLYGREPKTYYIGKRTGNLYRVRFLKYVGHLKPKASEKYADLITQETVLAELLPKNPYLPLRGLENAELRLKYRPEAGRKILCFEDELVNIVHGEEKMQLADLHRYLETE